ncbi:MAG: hypothetical protein JNL96_27880 [Planctomycetaceae bacterium]|nr:hypothetical protein [Planctomycetaceae bacterium]
MGARSKLNQAYVNGALVVAGIGGAICGSWVAFGVVFVTALALNLRNREIRLGDRRRRS